MPNRILRNWTDSLKFDGISAEGERLFVRLIMVADDYGRYHAEPRLLKAGCFPLQDQIRPNDLTRWLDELSHRQLILRYEVRGRTFLAIVNYGQRLKQSRAKFPPPDGEPDDFLPSDEGFQSVPGSSGKFPSESDTESDTESTPPLPPAGARARLPHTSPPPPADVPDELLTLTQAVTQAHLDGVPGDFASYVFDDWQSRGGKDGNGVQVAWAGYVKKRWNREQKAWEDGTHNGKKKNHDSNSNSRASGIGRTHDPKNRLAGRYADV